MLINQLIAVHAEFPEKIENNTIDSYYTNNSKVMMAICEQLYEQEYSICGGTLLSEYWLLTSQTCRKKKPFDELLIGVFESIFDRKIESSMRERYLHKWITHPNYEYSQTIVKNDIALVELDVIYSRYKSKELVKLSGMFIFKEIESASENSTKQCHFLFWPMKSFNWQEDARFIYLRTAMVKIIPRNKCREIVKNKVISIEQFCAAFLPGEPIPNEISSGPLLCEDLQVGLYTTKATDKKGSLLLIFTRVDYFQDYVQLTTSRHFYADDFSENRQRSLQPSIDDLEIRQFNTAFSKSAGNFCLVFFLFLLFCKTVSL